MAKGLCSRRISRILAISCAGLFLSGIPFFFLASASWAMEESQIESITDTIEAPKLKDSDAAKPDAHFNPGLLQSEGDQALGQGPEVTDSPANRNDPDPATQGEAAADEVAVEPEGSGNVFEFELSVVEAAPGAVVQVTGKCLFGGRPTDAYSSMMYIEDDGATSYNIPISTSVDIDGLVTGEVQIPMNAYSGAYDAFLMCLSGDAVFGSASQEFLVLGDNAPKPPAIKPPVTTPPVTVPPTGTPPAPVIPTELAKTGSSHISMLCSSFLLLLAGGGGLLAGRRHLRSNR
ncbi:hypothetical protein ACXR2W_11525 [Leucobacter sp. HY1908]